MEKRSNIISDSTSFLTKYVNLIFGVASAVSNSISTIDENDDFKYLLSFCFMLVEDVKLFTSIPDLSSF